MKYPTPEELMARASEQTGLSDFGSDSFRPGLEHTLQSLEQDAKLTEAGRDAAVPTLIRRLTNRLQIEEWFKKNPGAEKASITGPISIMGLPRTGTTALANMMSLDPQFRCLRAWEQAQPCPPPVLATELEDPRRLAYMKGMEGFLKANPEQMAMHLYDLDATMEDTDILGLEFAGQQMTWPLDGYLAWWREADMRATFAYHRRAALLLQSSRPPNRWLYKAPHHKFHLEAIAHAYPDVKFVFTHRDPAKVVPSYASFVLSHYPPCAPEVRDPHVVGKRIHEHLLRGMHRAVEARKRLGENRFVDVQQQETDGNPIGTLQRVYDFLKLDLTDSMKASVNKWVEVNHSGAHGSHKYTAEQFGLSVDQIRSDYDFYIRQFDVPVKK